MHDDDMMDCSVSEGEGGKARVKVWIDGILSQLPYHEESMMCRSNLRSIISSVLKSFLQLFTIWMPLDASLHRLPLN